jgi:hypothetical protein
LTRSTTSVIFKANGDRTYHPSYVFPVFDSFVFCILTGDGFLPSSVIVNIHLQRKSLLNIVQLCVGRARRGFQGLRIIKGNPWIRIVCRAAAPLSD